jgi:hypothetical protein
MPLSAEDVEYLLEKRRVRLGYDQLFPEERDYVLVGVFEAEVMNGGLHQFFWNNSGDHVEAISAAFRRLGAEHIRTVVAKAIEAFGPAGYPAGAERRRQMAADPDRYQFIHRLTDELHVVGEPVLFCAVDRVAAVYEAQGFTEADLEKSRPVMKTTATVLVVAAVLVVVIALAVALFD